MGFLLNFYREACPSFIERQGFKMAKTQAGTLSGTVSAMSV